MALFALLPAWTFAQAGTNISLNGEWTFALDPVKVGVQQQWFSPALTADRLDKVKVPHCFSVDPRYAFYTGKAWYFKKFKAPAVPNGYRSFLKFDAVFYKTRIWLNGKPIGEHEGGYTPFELDISDALANDNALAVEVDNSWDTTTIPGAKTAVDYQALNVGQLYPWINYGGITRPVHLITRPEVFVQNIKVLAEPDLKTGTAQVKITAFIKNLSGKAVQPTVQAVVYHEGNKVNTNFKPVASQVAANGVTTLVMESRLPAKEVKLWNQDEPNLYSAVVVAGSDTLTTRFGIRKLEISGTKLLLNGEPVKMGGANRPLDYPGYGSIDPEEVLEKDLTMMKSGCMELSRIAHYPVSENLLNWADAHGMLIIAEAGNWQMTPKQMDDAAMRKKFQSQMREMVERDWNHPCIVAYSVGNEFPSQTEAGKAWVRDMRQFVKSMDDSRLITFASMYVGRDFIHKPEDEASQYVDFISVNVYGNHLKTLQHIHEVYPGKPVYVSEFGIRIDDDKKEAPRMEHLVKAMQDFRQCDFLIGASVWTFNDYLSHFPGTDADGYRDWGLVSPQRDIRGMYTTWQEEFAPATVELVNANDKQATLQLRARADFPAYTLRGYQLRYNNQSIPLNTLKPGESQQITIPLSAAGAAIEVELVKPGGFVLMKKKLKA